MRRSAALFVSLSLVLLAMPSAALAARSGTAGSDTWIVTLRDGVQPSLAAPGLARAHGGQVGFVYEHAINGFSFHGSAAAATALGRNPNVSAVEANAEVVLDTTQSNATWGLDRIDQRNRPVNGSYVYERTGAGVTAYVIDSGIRFSHTEFGGRAVPGADFIGDGQNGNDCNGHGTHVAGTIGGATYGVAKAVALKAVRVFGCGTSSSWDIILAGINWVVADHQAGDPAVANLSLSGPATSSVDAAVNALINDGVATAVAAGNGNFLGIQANACNYSPARVPNAMTVSATGSNDTKASFANYGNCVDWFAPGVSITSAAHTSNTGTSVKSGTSMASPHTAGVAALYLEANPTSSPITVRDAIFNATTKGIVTSSSTANNHLLYTGFITGPDPDPEPNAPPTAVDDSATTDEGTSATISVLTNDTDADGDVLTVVSTTQPANGSANVNANGTITYTPNAGFDGSDGFDYTITDGEASDTGRVTVTVTATPDPPDITLTVDATKIRGVKTANLEWSGAGGSGMINILRNGSVVDVVQNTGSYTETLGKGGGTYTYQVCISGTTTCSNEFTVS